MDIHIHRILQRGVITEGYLTIDGNRICDTLENTNYCLPPGTYNITLTNFPFARSNGIHHLSRKRNPPPKPTKGITSVGTRACMGCIIRTGQAYQTLYERIKKSLQRKNQIQLIIQ